jgi:hypothetical protein
MSNVIAFTPRPRSPEPAPLLPLAGTNLRAHLEEAAQTALDAADRIIAALDLMDEADPRLTAMAVHAGQVVQLREAPVETEPAPAPTPEPKLTPQEAASAEPEAAETVPEKVAQPEPYAEPIRLPWRGAGNVVAATGCAILALVGVA